ncbi:MAG TPA: hypothetical protein VET90_05955 [Candidatus Binatus sp.]|nr:hypothetical protein [Candidatus Binatus sp.]
MSVAVVPSARAGMAAIPSIEGHTVAIEKSAVGGVRADSVTVEQGVVGGALAGSVSVRQSFARTVLAQRVEIGQSLVRSLVANEVHVRPSTNVGLLIARRVDGDVKVLLDWRGAAILGAVAGLVGGLARAARSRRR